MTSYIFVLYQVNCNSICFTLWLWRKILANLLCGLTSYVSAYCIKMYFRKCDLIFVEYQKPCCTKELKYSRSNFKTCYFVLRIDMSAIFYKVCHTNVFFLNISCSHLANTASQVNHYLISLIFTNDLNYCAACLGAQIIIRISVF
jgi:hypothetical protein